MNSDKVTSAIYHLSMAIAYIDQQVADGELSPADRDGGYTFEDTARQLQDIKDRLTYNAEVLER